MLPDKLAFNRKAVRPLVCLREGWHLVKDAYWLFLGICVVGYLIASMGPMGLLVGPTFCGIHLCLLRHERGLPVTFDMLFNGFHYFVQSLVATLVITVPAILVFGVCYVGSIVCGIFIGVLMDQARAGEDNAALVGVLIGVIILLVGGFIVFELVLQTLFFFAFPLIVDRELSGMDAVKLSYRAAMGNFGGLLGLVLLTIFLDLIGVLMCYVGVIFLLPVHLAMVTIAYRQVFPTADDNLIVEAHDPESDAPFDAPAAPVANAGISAL